MNRIVTDYKNRQNAIVTIGYRVLEKMENNEAFPDPPAVLEELKKVLPEYQQSLVDARGGDKEMTAIKNDKKAFVIDLLQELVDYVTLTCKDNRSLMLSSGFDVNEENGSGNKQSPSIGKLEVELGPPGEAVTRIKNVTGAIAFVHQFTTEPPGIHTRWFGEGTSLGSYTFKDLNSEKRHWFRVVAIGYYGQRGYSPIVTRVIQ